MTRRTRVLGAILTLLAMPLVLGMTKAVTFVVRNASNRELVSMGRTRDYLLYVPKRYDPAKPTPLVISLHGGSMWGAAQRDMSGWNPIADREGFIVVYPSGLGGNGPRAWRLEPRPDGPSRDVIFISELIDTLEAHYNIDRRRIYANGLSNGGGMAFVLSCTMPDRIAAVGMVAPAHMLPWIACTDRHAVPMIQFHGTADPQVPYRGGRTFVGHWWFPNVPAWAAKWAARNGCAPVPADSAVAADVTRRTYSHCTNDANVVLYTLIGGGHTWPGPGDAPEWFVGPVNHDVDASSIMWQFFREHPLR